MSADFAGTTKILSSPGTADPGMVASNIDAWKSSLGGLGSAPAPGICPTPPPPGGAPASPAVRRRPEQG